MELLYYLPSKKKVLAPVATTTSGENFGAVESEFHGSVAVMASCSHHRTSGTDTFSAIAVAAGWGWLIESPLFLATSGSKDSFTADFEMGIACWNRC